MLVLLWADPNEYIAKSVRRAELLLLDFINFNDFEDDKSVDIEIFLGNDPDGDRSNNFDGTEFTVTCSSLTSEGLAESQFIDAQIENGVLTGSGGAFDFWSVFQIQKYCFKMPK